MDDQTEGDVNLNIKLTTKYSRKMTCGVARKPLPARKGTCGNPGGIQKLLLG